MWRVRLLAVAMVFAVPSVVQGGIAEPPDMNIAWDQCGVGGASFKNFACDSNTGSSVIVVSFAPLQSLDVELVDTDVLMQTQGGAALPSWWALGAGGCRSGAMVLSSDRGGDAGCAELVGNQVFGWTFIPDWAGPGTGRIMVEIGPGAPGVTVSAGVEYFGFKIVLNHTKSVGTDSCGGCSTQMSIRLGTVVVSYADGRQDELAQPIRQDTIVLQSGTTPARTSTWGQIKALYR